MKNYLLHLFLLFSVCTTQAQVVTGVYKGKMEVDSPKYSIDFELTLKEKEGKLVGYCQRLFIVEDVLYFNLVKVTARIADSVLIVEDDKSVSNNFREKTTGVKTVMFFKLQTDHDTVSVMPGEWSTSRTKKYLPITGSVSVSRERNYLATQLYKRLDEKQLGKDMLFEDQTQPIVATTQIRQTKTTTAKPNSIQTDATVSAANKQPEIVTPSKQTSDSVQTTKTKPITIRQPKPTDVAVQQNKPVPVNQQQPATNKPLVNKDTIKTTTTAVVITTVQPKPTDVAVQQNKPVPVNQQQPATNKPQINKDTIKPTTTAVVTTTVQPKPTDVAVQQNKPVPVHQQQQANQKPEIVKDSVKTNTNTSVVNKPNNNATNVAMNPGKPVTIQPTTSKPLPVTNTTPQKPTTAVTGNKPSTNTNPQQQTTAVTTKPAQQQPINPVAQTQQQVTINSVGNTIVEHNTTKPTGPSTHPVINNPLIVKRQTEIIDALELTGDSVVLSLYDNGEIDGDTVSVFVNNELVLSRVGLKASAYKHTIAIQPGEIIQLTLFAENLGSIPPNTGLLVITTNNERYQVHFSSTLNKNASVVLRRKQ